MNCLKNLKGIAYLVLLIFAMLGCRKDLITDIKTPPVVNQPPKISEINDITLTPGFATYEVDLANYVTDQEGDIITYQAFNSVDSVITISLDGSVITITEVGEGTSTIDFTASDGNVGNEVSSSFDVTVQPILGAPDVDTDYIMFDFNGFGEQDLYVFDVPGLIIEKADYDWEGAYVGENILLNDHAFFSISVENTQMWFEAELEDGNQDYTGKKMRFDYMFFTGTNLTGTDLDDDPAAIDIFIYFVSEDWSSGGRYFLSNANMEYSAEWQTVEIPLADFESMWDYEVLPDAVGVIGMQWYGGTSAAPLSMRMDNFGIVD